MYEAQVEKAEETFEQLDTDRDGCIDALEFRSLIVELTGEDPEIDLGDTFASIDTDGDGLIDFGEFTQWWSQSEREE